MKGIYYVKEDKFVVWAENNNWLCVADYTYLTPKGVLVSIVVIDECVVDIKVCNDSMEV